jgi:hypothetical protein
MLSRLETRLDLDGKIKEQRNLLFTRATPLVTGSVLLKPRTTELESGTALRGEMKACCNAQRG